MVVSGLKITATRQLRMFCSLSVNKKNTMNFCKVREDRGRILLAFVSAKMVGKNSNTLNLKAMAEYVVGHYMGRYRSSGIPFSICDLNKRHNSMKI